MIIEGYKELTDVPYDNSESLLIYMWHPPKYPSILSHWHERMEFIYVLEGVLNVTCGSFSDEIKEGELIVVNPNQMHAATSGDVDVKYYALVVDNKFLNDICITPSNSKFIAPILQRKIRFKTHIKDDEINKVLLAIIKEYQNKEYAYELAIQANIILLFSLLNRLYIDNDDNSVVIDNSFGKILEYIDEHFTEEISTDSVAELFSFNKSHFCRKFKSQTGMPFMKYLNLLRLELARSFLMTTNKSMTAIAGECGYNDLNYFSRKFQEYYGITSREFRKKFNKILSN